MAYFMPGTGEINDKADPSVPVGMLKGVADQIKRKYGSSVGTYFVPYPAGMPADGGVSARKGAENLRAAIERCPMAKVLLIGYSQGAKSTGDVAVDIGNGRGPVPASQVRAVTLLADPQNGTKGGVQAGDPVKGVGISGPRAEGFGALSGLVKEFCNHGDKYCDTDPSASPLTASLGRILGGGSTAVSLPVSGSTAKPAGSASTSQQADAVAPASTTGADGASTASTAGGGGDVAKLVSPLLPPAELNKFLKLVQPQDYSRADLARVPATVKSLTASVDDLSSSGGTQTPAQLGQLAVVRAQAQSLLDTLTPIAGTSKWVGGNKTVSQQLATSPKGSAEKNTSDLLSGPLSTGNVAQILTGASELVKLSDSILGPAKAPGTAQPATGLGTVTGSQSGAGAVVAAPAQATVTASSKPAGISDQAFKTMQLNTKKIGTGSAALAGSDVDLSQVGSVLSGIQPQTVLKGVGAAIQAAVTTDYQGIVGSLQSLPGVILSGNIPAAHKMTSGLLEQMKPLVQAASGVDYGSLAKIIALVPDSSGSAPLISAVLSLLSNMDFARGFNAVTQLNDKIFRFLETGNLLELASMVPVGMELAQVATGLLVPGPKQAPAPAVAPAATPQASGSAQSTAAAGNFQQIGTQLVALAASPQAGSLMNVAKEGIDFATFFQNGVPPAHVSYASNGKVSKLTSTLISGLDG